VQQAPVLRIEPQSDAPDVSGLMFLFIALALGVGVFRPKLLRRVAGVVDATPEQLGATRRRPTDGDLHRPSAASPVDRPSGFGRKQR